MKKRVLSILLTVVMCLAMAAPALAAERECLIVSFNDFTIVDGELKDWHRTGGAATIPDGVTSIGYSAFAGSKGMTSVTIPDSVTRIRGCAFQDCTGLTSVTIPDSVTAIGYAAFMGCTGLTSVTLPRSLTTIRFDTFRGCTSLTSVTIPDSVTAIEGSAFFGCTGLKDVYFTGTEAQWKAIEIEGGYDTIKSAAIHYNSPMPDQPQQPTLPTVEPIPAEGTAVPTTQTVKLDGKDVSFQYYAVKDANGNPTNYVKIRALANALNGTKAQFEVDWNGNNVVINSGKAYAPNGSEGSTPYSGNQAYRSVSSDPVSFNGKEVNLTSFRITHQGGGDTYYKLRDLGQLLNFEVRWDGGAKSIVIETDKPYTGK